MRLFIAAQLPETLRDALSETQAQLRACVRGRYVAPDSLHVTLAFLGDVEPYRAADAQEALARACEGICAFEASLGDFGSFGKRAKATLWQGFRKPGALPEAASRIREQLKRAQLPFDSKTFLAHVTLMRAADLTSGELPMPVLASGEIASIALMSSDLGGERPRYEALHVAELAQGSAKQ